MNGGMQKTKVLEYVGENLLQVVNLKTYFFVRRGTIKAVDGVNIFLKKGEVLGLLGESGCGKSVTGLSILRLVPDPPGEIVDGQIIFEGEDLLLNREKDMRKIRGRKVTMIQQNPDSSLNPVFRIGNQIIEAMAIHKKLDKNTLWKRMVKMLRLVKIDSPEERAFNYPHQMSGGMRQRVAGAIALSCNSKLLIADEPTTNLDVTTQMEYIKLLKEIQRDTKIGILFITHDFGVVSRICDRVAVMYAGKIVETGPMIDIMNRPRHPYTVALINSVPNPEKKGTQLSFIKGQPPDMINLPPHCTFAERCPRATEKCYGEYPKEKKIDENHTVSCYYA